MTEEFVDTGIRVKNLKIEETTLNRLLEKSLTRELPKKKGNPSIPLHTSQECL